MNKLLRIPIFMAFLICFVRVSGAPTQAGPAPSARPSASPRRDASDLPPSIRRPAWLWQCSAASLVSAPGNAYACRIASRGHVAYLIVHVLGSDGHVTASHLVALDVPSGRVLWKYLCTEQHLDLSEPLFRGDPIYAVASDTVVRALRPSDGRELWRFACAEGHKMSRKVAGPDALYVTVEQQKASPGPPSLVETLALDAHTGKVLWRAPGTIARPVGHFVILRRGAADDSSGIACLHRDTGQVAWEHPHSLFIDVDEQAGLLFEASYSTSTFVASRISTGDTVMRYSLPERLIKTETTRQPGPVGSGKMGGSRWEFYGLVRVSRRTHGQARTVVATTERRSSSCALYPGGGSGSWGSETTWDLHFFDEMTGERTGSLPVGDLYGRGTPRPLDILRGKGRIQAVDTATGRRQWTHPTARSEGDAPPLGYFLEGRFLLVFARSLQALDLDTGRMAWSSPLDVAPDEVKVDHGSLLLVPRTGRSLSSLDPATGRVRWTFTPKSSSPAEPSVDVRDGVVLFGTREAVYTVDLETGAALDVHTFDARAPWSRAHESTKATDDGRYLFFFTETSLHTLALPPRSTPLPR